MEAIADRIVVKEDPAAAVSAGGVFLPEGAREETSRGEVLSVGGRVKEVNVGDRVLYTKFDGREVETDAGGYSIVILTEAEVIGVIE